MWKAQHTFHEIAQYNTNTDTVVAMDAFKESVYGLLGEEEEEGLFGKDTFVLSPEDLEILNNDVQRQILDEEEDLFDDSHEEEKIQKSTGWAA